MKTFCVASIYLLIFMSASFGALVTVPDTSAELPDVAAATIALLIDDGTAVKKGEARKFIVKVDNFHCDQYSRGPFDASDPLADLPTIKCRTGAENIKGTETGRPFTDSRAMSYLLQKIQNSSASNGVQFGDCAMGGYCSTFLKSISCTINTAIENFDKGGRWACTFVDGQ